MATPNLPYRITTTIVGDLLDQEHWEKDPSTSINYFMILLGKPISSLPEISEDEFSEMLRKLYINIWRPMEDGWESRKLLFFKFDKCNTERQQEERINSEIREFLKESYKKEIVDTHLPPLPDIGIIFTRACLYTRAPKEIQQTNQIGAILRSKYKEGDTSIDYFYLIVQEENKYPNLHKTADDELKKLQQGQEIGEWRAMSEEHWPGVFIGHYPKTPFMTEREREWSLDKKVREPLKERITTTEAKVHIIITRACLYTASEPGLESVQDTDN